MAEKKTAKKENSQINLEEILGDIKNVVSEEKETLFKVSDYKTIKLKKENLINSGKKNHSSAIANLDNKKLEERVKKIVRSELKNLQFWKSLLSLSQRKQKLSIKGTAAQARIC